jgi:hypothetical protein
MNYKPVQNRILVTIQSPKLWFLSALGLIALLALIIWSAFVYGQKVAGYDKGEAVAYIDDLQQQLDETIAQKAESEHQAAMLERNSVIDGGATEQLKKSLSEVQAESLELKKELSFYKSIVSPEQAKRSVAIQTIQLKPDQKGGYTYKIMVSQRGRNDRFTRGNIEVTLEGSQEGQAKTLKLSEVSGATWKPIKFGFKYFQNFEGLMILPITFRAEYMRVQVKPRSSKMDSIDEKFAWADLTAGGEQHVGQQQKNTFIQN